MTDRTAGHREAAARHEMAAANHDRAATFWDGRGDQDRADLQREMALYERYGAELEYRWADVIDPNRVISATRAAQAVVQHTQQGAKHLALTLQRTARALEKSAELAEQEAARRAQAGQDSGADEEHQAATHAREAAQRARVHAEEWARLGQPRPS